MGFWNDEEIGLLKANLDKTNLDIATMLHRSVSAVREKKRSLGLKKEVESQIGKKYGYLTVIGEVIILNPKTKQHNTYANCTCECGNKHQAMLSEIKRGNVKSCGCISPVKVGEKLFRLTVLHKYTQSKDGHNKTYVHCLCECGNTTDIRLTSIRQGHVKSCGCLKAEKASERMIKQNFKHGMGDLKSRIYRIWCQMRSRCNLESHPFYHYYGGRGVEVCNNWNKDFVCFYDWAISNNYSDKLSIDRINVDGNYEPSNCRWATPKEQARNRRNNRVDTVKITAFGETQTMQQWLDDQRCVIKSCTTLCYRIGAGWHPEDAISKPSERSKG